jgi:hypothetical protein
MRPGAMSLNSNMIRDGHPACRLKPASPAVPAASAKEENKNNNDEKCLGIHDVQPFQCDGFGLGFSTISAFARMHIIWGDAIVPASSRSASSRSGRSFRPTGLMKRNERIADLIEKAGREEAAASASRVRRRGSGRLAPCFPVQRKEGLRQNRQNQNLGDRKDHNQACFTSSAGSTSAPRLSSPQTSPSVNGRASSVMPK